MRRILIIKPSSMGDIIHGLLVAETIQAQVPGVEIDWVVRREFSPLVDLASAITRTYIFERDGGLSGFFRLVSEIREQRYDVVLDMQGLARSGILTYFARAGRKIGRFDAREGAGFFYKEKTAPPPGEDTVHAVEILAGFLKALGLNVDSLAAIRFGKTSKSISLPPAEGASRRIIIFPESRRAEKNWSGYESLTRALLDTLPDTQIIWCGHLSYVPEKTIDSERFVNLTGATGIDQLPELLETAHCVVSNDSGPMHLAAAMARPLVAIFGPTDPARFGPYPVNHDRQRVLRRKDGDMASLSVDEVKQAIMQVLGC